MNPDPVRALLLLLIFAGTMNAQTNTVKFHSAVAQTTLLELYTSEGCSSCPPAEERLSGLTDSPGLWDRFVPVAFHVDYWDYLGWRDPWGTAGFSDRQRTYARLWRSDTIYTPGFVLNGKEYGDWLRLVLPATSSPHVGVLTATLIDTNRWRVSFAPAGSTGDYEAYAALLVNGVASDVKAGENRGRRLHHDFVVLALVHAPLVRHGDLLAGDIRFDPPRHSSGRLAFAAWITRAGRLEPIQATGGWLQTPVKE